MATYTGTSGNDTLSGVGLADDILKGWRGMTLSTEAMALIRRFIAVMRLITQLPTTQRQMNTR